MMKAAEARQLAKEAQALIELAELDRIQRFINAAVLRGATSIVEEIRFGSTIEKLKHLGYDVIEHKHYKWKYTISW